MAHPLVTGVQVQGYAMLWVLRQLLVCIPFREAVKLHTITILSHDGGA